MKCKREKCGLTISPFDEDPRGDGYCSDHCKSMHDLERDLAALRSAVEWMHDGTEAEQHAKLDKWNEVQLFEHEDPATALLRAHEESKKQ